MAETKQANDLRSYLPELLSRTAELHGGNMPPTAAIECARVVEQAIADLIGQIEKHKGLDALLAKSIAKKAHPKAPPDVNVGEIDVGEIHYVNPGKVTPEVWLPAEAAATIGLLPAPPPLPVQDLYTDDVKVTAKPKKPATPPPTPQDGLLAAHIASKVLTALGLGSDSSYHWTTSDLSIELDAGETAKATLSGPYTWYTWQRSLHADDLTAAKDQLALVASMASKLSADIAKSTTGSGYALLTLPKVTIYQQDDDLEPVIKVIAKAMVTPVASLPYPMVDNGHHEA